MNIEIQPSGEDCNKNTYRVEGPTDQHEGCCIFPSIPREKMNLPRPEGPEGGSFYSRGIEGKIQQAECWSGGSSTRYVFLLQSEPLGCISITVGFYCTSNRLKKCRFKGKIHREINMRWVCILLHKSNTYPRDKAFNHKEGMYFDS